MYVSKYYTCEEIDQRLLQGYYDDSLAHGFVGTLKEFWAFFLSIANKVDKKEGWDLSENNFSDELLEKLNGIEEHANYVTKVSQLENDLKYQTQEQVEKYIHDLVDGADDALDTLKELAEALNNDPNFATNITNRLTELRTQLEAEVTRAKNRENELASQIKIVNDNLVNSVNTLNATIIKVVQDITRMIEVINARIQKVEDRVGDLEVETDNNLTEAKEYAKELVDKEAAERRAADEKLTEAVHKVQLDHTRDIADLNNKILTEASERANADVALESKLNTEISDRKTADQELESKINAEAAARTAQDEVLHQQIVKETSDRQNADNGLQQNITQEAQNRQNADTVLQNNIDNEKETRIAQDEILDHKIEDLKTQAGTDKTELLEKLEQEKQERIAADKDLDNRKVDKREGYSLTKNDFTDILKAKLDGIEEHANYITKVSQLINDAGYQTEVDLQAAIEKIIGEAPEVLDTLKEIADALGNDPNFATTITKKLAAITEQLNQEITNRTEADAQVQANVDKEVSDRKEADTALEAKLKEYVDNEVDKITGNTDGIQASLNKEIQDRKDADAALQAAITKEETDRKAADAALDTRVTANATKIQELALSIQDAVNTVKNELQAKIDALQTEVNTNKANIQRNTDRLNDQITKEAEDYAELEGMVNAEAEARANADTNLKSQVDKVNIDLNTEVSKREAGDTVLQQNIDKEISDRTSADTLLDNKFTGLINTESTARANEDEKINARIDQEIKDRKAGDDALSTRIDSLNSGVTGSLDELREKVTNNTTAIQTEVERAKAAEQAIKDSLTTAMENHKDDLVAISKDIHDESQNRLLEDTKLQNAIDAEKVARENADNTLTNKLSQETADRTTAINQLNNAKVDKVDGKELSSNDFTDLLKAKLDNIQEFANYITKVSQLENDSNYQNAEQVEAAIQKVIGSAPGVLDTLEEIAKALGDDPNFATTITNKLTELKGIIDKEISDRTAADEQVTQKFTELSTTLNATVSELRTFVTETRSELLTKAQAQDELIAKNTANIQRNLELIQGLQSNQNTGYLEIKELLNTEIEARKAEDIRIEAKVDKNTQDLTTERNERIAADKVLQDNIDAEEAARIAADNALGKRIDKEIEDRKAADTALENKFNGITNGLDERLQKEEATSDALPLTVVTEIDPNLVINGTSAEVNFKSSVKGEENIYGEAMPRKFAIPSSTNTKAGLQTAADKKKWDSMPGDIITGVSYTAKADVVTTNVNRSTYNAEEGIQKSNDFTINLPASTSEKAGVQTAADKKKFDSVPQTIVVGEGATSNDKEVTISVNRKTVSEGVYKDDNTVFNLPVASTTKAGTMSAADKKLLDSLPLNISINSTTIERDSTKVVIKRGYVNNSSGVYDNNQPLYDLINLPASTSEKAGVQTAADKKKFDSLPDKFITNIKQGPKSIDRVILTKNTSSYSLENGVYQVRDEIEDIVAATKTTAGVMSAQDKINLDETLPNAIAKEVQDRKDAIAALESSSNASIEALEKKHDDFVATKGQANGFASLDGNGLVPSSQLPSYVDDVIEVYATYDVSETGKLSNIKLYSDSDHANPITGESGKIYLNITQDEPSYQFRWSGTQFVDSNTSSLILGEVTGTAYDGGKGKHLSDWRKALGNNLGSYSHIKNNKAWTRNANEVRLNFDCSNFVDPVGINSYHEPILAATKDLAGVQTAADKKLFDSIPGGIVSNITSSKADESLKDKNVVRLKIENYNRYNTENQLVLPEYKKVYWEITLPSASAEQAGTISADMFNKLNSGLNGDITNALNEAKAYTDAAKTALNKLITDEAAARQAADKVIQDNLNAHIGNTSNPHKVTKAQIGLGNVQNLAPADMPVSTAQATAIADAKAAGTKAQTDLNAHANRRDNPHNVTRAQLGLATTDQVVFAKTTAASGFWKESDGRLKSQVENLNHTLDQICNIPTVHFKMNGKYQVGTIAQSLEEIEPLLVSENTIPASQVPNQSRFETFVGEDGQEYVKVKVVEYEMLSVMALEGVKLLRKEFEDFKKQLNNK
nr:MAG: Nucleoporin FG repeated region protein [Bacteriophage sp.]